MKRFLCIGIIGTLLCASALAEAVSVTVPETYSQTGTLPVYRVVTRSTGEAPLYDQIQPEWLNQSGTPTYENWSRSGRYDHYVFPDGAELEMGPELVYYNEYDGTMETLPLEENATVSTLPRPTLQNSIGDLAGSARQCWPGLDEQPQLEQTRLGSLTLEDAKARLEALLARLGLTDYRCVYALDMSVERIHTLGENYKQKIQHSNVPFPDFETAGEDDQGFYLYYEKCIDDIPLDHERQDGGSFSASAYVTAEGIPTLTVRESHAIGDVYSVPDKLIDADAALAAFEKGNAKRQRDGFGNGQAVALTLTYRPMRAPKKKDGVVLAPAWLVEYTCWDGGQNDCYAWYSATDGSLIADCYSR